MPERRATGRSVAHKRKSSAPSQNHSDDQEQEPWDEDDDAGDADEEPEVSGHPSKKRRIRPLSVSCELCKTRKVKCDRAQPSCGWCLKNNQPCDYKERKKPGLRAGYGRELEARLDRLEGLIRQQQETINALTNNGFHQPAPQHSPSSVPTFRSPPPVQAAHDPQLATALLLQKPSAHAHSPQYEGYATAPLPQSPYPQSLAPLSTGRPASSSLTSITRDLYSQPNPALESPSLNLPGAPLKHVATPDGDYPPYDLLYSLCDIFFKHVNTWCPLLHRRSTLDALFGHTPLQEEDRILLHAIVATTLRFSSDPRLTDELRERYHEVSKQKVLLYGLENSSVKALQALVILALDVVGASNGPPGWNLLALITRSVVQLGLAVEPNSTTVVPGVASIYTLRAITLPEAKDWIEDESRRRLFWVVYLLDRYATVSTAFDFALSDSDIDRKLPCRDDLFARNQPVETRWFTPGGQESHSVGKAENLGSFSYYIEVIGILSRIHRFLKKPVDISALLDVEQWQREFRELDNMLGTWKYNLPAEYANMSRVLSPSSGNKIVNAGWVMLHAAYNTTVIRLHSSAGYPTTRSPIFTPSYAASQRCMQAVEALVDLVNVVRSPSQANAHASGSQPAPTSSSPKDTMLNKLGPPFAFSVWVAARMLLVHGSTVDRHVSPQMYPLLDTLREMGRYWKVAERYASLLTRVMDEYESSERDKREAVSANTGHGDEDRPSTPTAVKILADMRRTAFDLDFLISRQPVSQRSGPAAALYNVQNVSNDNTQSGMDTLSAAAAAVRPPQQNELEYLDVFDFFNLPRLPPSFEGIGLNDGFSDTGQTGGANNEFNISNYMVDASSDWFVKTPT